MTPLIKVFVGFGVVTPVAGTLGGTLISTSKANSLTAQVNQVERDQRSQTNSVMDVAPPLTVSHSSDTDHSQGLTAKGPESDLQETTKLVASMPEVSVGQEALTPEDSSKERVSGIEESSQSHHEDSATTLQIQEQFVEEQEAETGNCTIINPLSKIIEATGGNAGDYYSVSCDSKGIEGREDEDTIPNQWEGVFPKSIFKNQNLSQNKKVEIKVREEDENFGDYELGDDEEYLFKISFSGSSLIDTEDSLLAGKWNDCDEVDSSSDEESKAVAKVKLVKPDIEKFIYLSWNT